MEKKQTHYGTSSLKEQGWTDSLIKKYLGEPDKLAKNPVYSSKSPMRLYLISRIESVVLENDLLPVLQDNLVKRVKRSQSAITAVDTKRQKILTWVNSLKIQIPQYSYKELIELAVDHYNGFQLDRCLERGRYEDIKQASVDDNSEFLYRITHNYLRHEETRYERIIDIMFGRIGKQEAYEALKEKITNEINKAYPELMKYLESRQSKEIIPSEQLSLVFQYHSSA